MIRFAPEAVDDLARVRDFLDANSPDAAKRAVATVFAALQRLEDFPNLGRPTDDVSIRQIVVPFGSACYVLRYVWATTAIFSSCGFGTVARHGHERLALA